MKTYAQFCESTAPMIEVGGRKITVMRPPRTPGEELVWVDVPKFDSAWSRDGSFYLNKQGSNRIGSRYQNVEKFMQTTDALNASEVAVTKSGTVVFGDGRHRFAFLRDQGLKSVPVSMTPESQRYARIHGLLSSPTG